MDNIYKLGIGLVLFVITSLITYLFKKHQLYIAASALFKRTAFSSNGQVCQITVFNKGNHVEEEISVTFDPSLQIELLASDNSGLEFKNNELTVDRLHKSKSISALILIENSDFEISKIVSANSKATVAKVLKKATEVPPNWAMLFLGVIVLLGFLPALVGTFTLVDYIVASRHDNLVQTQLKPELDQGWHNLGNYMDSELRKSYGNQEFPLQFTGTFQKDGHLMAKFNVYNKTAIQLDVTADRNMKADDSKDLTYFSAVSVPPMSNSLFEVVVPPPNPESRVPEIAFTFRSGSEFTYQFYFTPKIP